MTLRLGWFTTARGAGSRGMWDAVTAAIDRGEIDAEIAVVFCNRDPGEDPTTDAFLDAVRARGIPLVTRSSAAFRRAVDGRRSQGGAPLPAWRADYDGAILDALAPYPFDLGVLAGFMLILGEAFVERLPLLNLHPALPDGPAGTWREVICSLIRDRAAESGVMLHLAIAEVDAGPVVTYCRFPIRDAALAPAWAAVEASGAPPDDAALEASALFAEIRRRGVERERPLLVATVAAFARGERAVRDARIVLPDGRPAGPLDLTAEVERRVATP